MRLNEFPGPWFRRHIPQSATRGFNSEYSPNHPKFIHSSSWVFNTISTSISTSPSGSMTNQLKKDCAGRSQRPLIGSRSFWFSNFFRLSRTAREFPRLTGTSGSHRNQLLLQTRYRVLQLESDCRASQGELRIPQSCRSARSSRHLDPTFR